MTKPGIIHLSSLHLDNFISKSIGNAVCCKAVSVSLASRSCLPYFSGRISDIYHGVSSIHDTLGPVAQFLIIDRIMVRSNENEIEARNAVPIPINRFLAGPTRVFASGPDHWDVGIVIFHFGAAFTQR